MAHPDEPGCEMSGATASMPRRKPEHVGVEPGTGFLVPLSLGEQLPRPRHLSNYLASNLALEKHELRRLRLDKGPVTLEFSKQREITLTVPRVDVERDPECPGADLPANVCAGDRRVSASESNSDRALTDRLAGRPAGDRADGFGRA